MHSHMLTLINAADVELLKINLYFGINARAPICIRDCREVRERSNPSVGVCVRCALFVVEGTSRVNLLVGKTTQVK